MKAATCGHLEAFMAGIYMTGTSGYNNENAATNRFVNNSKAVRIIAAFSSITP